MHTTDYTVKKKSRTIISMQKKRSLKAQVEFWKKKTTAHHGTLHFLHS
jgi:hypothetical protein